MCVCVCVCVRACVRACVCVRVGVVVGGCVCTWGLRIVSMDKMLCFTNILISIITINHFTVMLPALSLGNNQ